MAFFLCGTVLDMRNSEPNTDLRKLKHVCGPSLYMDIVASDANIYINHWVINLGANRMRCMYSHPGEHRKNAWQIHLCCLDFLAKGYLGFASPNLSVSGFQQHSLCPGWRKNLRKKHSLRLGPPSAQFAAFA